MHATLIYNTNAGSTDVESVDELSDALRKAGFEPHSKETTSVEQLDPILEEAEGLILSAGGDGTAREIIMRIMGRKDVYFTPLPMGTANNVCRSLGIQGNPLDIIHGLSTPKERHLDLGRVEAPWGTDTFLEGAGIGFFAEALAAYDPEQGKSTLRSIQSLIETFQRGFVREATLRLPEEEVTGRFLLIEVLNTTAVGPHLKFAPDADPTDGLLNVLCIREERGEGYLQYLRGLLTEDLPTLEGVEVYQTSELRLSWDGFPVHVDAVVRPSGYDFRDKPTNNHVKLHAYPDLPSDSSLHIFALPGVLQVWLPQMQEGVNA
jgi:diacylglycerol kinase family enzyme